MTIAGVAAEQRFTRNQLCPVCAGHSTMPQGKGLRCYGFLSGDGGWAHCTRDELAAGLEREASDTYAHKLAGECRCGKTHGPDRGPMRVAADETRVLRRTRDRLVDADGHEVAVHVRIDYMDGTKSCPWERNGKLGLDGLAVTDLPLFGVRDLVLAAPDAEVVVVEGEPAQKALKQRGILAMGTVTGADKTPSLASLRPLVGHRPILWPDNDVVGSGHMNRIAAAVVELGEQPRIVRWTEAPPKGDAADFQGTDEALRQLLADAKAWAPTTETTASFWPEPEDRGEAVLSEQGGVEYVDDMVRPGRIIVWAAEEGSGKSFTVDDELAIRMAVAGGSLAGTWPIVQKGGVLVLSEMHSDDDYEREETTLASLGLDRAALKGKYFRLPLMTAANGTPALMSAEWRSWVVEWCKQHEIILQVFDTATGATQGDPWGDQIREVFRSLRVMLEAYPLLAIILIVHLKKPTGQGARRISDVMGEWGRWCDVIVMQERDGARTKLSTLKRVRTERRIVATRLGGLLVEPKDIGDGSGPKVPLEKVVEAVHAFPGITVVDLAARLDVVKMTAARYAKAAEAAGHIRQEKGLPKGTIRLFPTSMTATPQQAATRDGVAVDEAVYQRRLEPTATPQHSYISVAVGDAVMTASPNGHGCVLCGLPAQVGADLCGGCEEQADR